jgi:hypothetical protein
VGRHLVDKSDAEHLHIAVELNIPVAYRQTLVQSLSSVRRIKARRLPLTLLQKHSTRDCLSQSSIIQKDFHRQIHAASLFVGQTKCRLITDDQYVRNNAIISYFSVKYEQSQVISIFRYVRKFVKGGY